MEETWPQITILSHIRLSANVEWFELEIGLITISQSMGFSPHIVFVYKFQPCTEKSLPRDNTCWTVCIGLYSPRYLSPRPEETLLQIKGFSPRCHFFALTLSVDAASFQSTCLATRVHTPDRESLRSGPPLFSSLLQ